MIGFLWFSEPRRVLVTLVVVSDFSYRVDKTITHKRRWLIAVLPSEDLDCALIIRILMKNEILCLGMTHCAGEVGTGGLSGISGISAPVSRLVTMEHRCATMSAFLSELLGSSPGRSGALQSAE